jgi:hypothetical protein
LPLINPPMDMVTYSSYESNVWQYGTGGDVQATVQPLIVTEMNKALGIINQFAPDPLKLGKKRILISEYGMPENNHAAGSELWRSKTILDTAKSYGIAGAYYWELYDNECDAFTGEVAGVIPSTGVPAPTPSTLQDCTGYWIKRFDGTTFDVLSVL